MSKVQEAMSWINADDVVASTNVYADDHERRVALEAIQSDRAELVRTAIGVRLIEEKESIEASLENLGYGNNHGAEPVKGPSGSYVQPFDKDEPFPPFSLLLRGAVARPKTAKQEERFRVFRDYIGNVLGNEGGRQRVGKIAGALASEHFFTDNPHFEGHYGIGVSFINPHMKEEDVIGRNGRTGPLGPVSATALIKLAHKLTETVTY